MKERKLQKNVIGRERSSEDWLSSRMQTCQDASAQLNLLRERMAQTDQYFLQFASIKK